MRDVWLRGYEFDAHDMVKCGPAISLLCSLLARGLNSQLSQRDEELAGLRKELQEMKDSDCRFCRCRNRPPTLIA